MKTNQDDMQNQEILNPSSENLSPENLRLDYQQTCEQFRLLADIRFKLLAFVPTLTGAAIALLGDKVQKEFALVVGIIGFFVTFGIIIYDLRNSQFYTSAIVRARYLESLMCLPNYHRRSKQPKIYGGIFTERPSRPTFKLFPIVKKLSPAEADRDTSITKITLWHDRGLALVYAASLGGWIFIIINSALLLLKLDRINVLGAVTLNAAISILFSIIMSIIIYIKYLEIARKIG